MNNTLDKDQLQRFIFDDTDIRGEIVTLHSSLEQVFSRQSYPPPIQNLLGEFMAAVALLSSTLKFDGRLTLQARGDGPLPLIMADADHKQQLRAIAKFGELPENIIANLPSLIGKGALTITIEPDQGNRYQGIVPLAAATLSDCLEHYFTQSEQLPTRIWLASDGNTAAGILLQQLPQALASPTANAEAWENRIQLTNTLTTEELLTLEHSQLLTRLYHEEGVRCFEATPLSFGCDCSKQRCSMALKHLGKDDAEGLIQESGKIEIDCEFCGTQYTFGSKDLVEIFVSDTRH